MSKQTPNESTSSMGTGDNEFTASDDLVELPWLRKYMTTLRRMVRENLTDPRTSELPKNCKDILAAEEAKRKRSFEYLKSIGMTSSGTIAESYFEKSSKSVGNKSGK